MDKTLVSAKNLSVERDGKLVFSSANFCVNRGEFVAVIGPNGSGKSTLINTIAGIQEPSGGTLEVNVDKHRIGYLPQRHRIAAGGDICVFDIVGLGFDAHKFTIPLLGNIRKRNAATNKVLQLVGASKIAHKPIGKLSGGQQQLALIAQALVSEPELLLLDEPLDSLDYHTQLGLAELVAKTTKKLNLATMIVIHDINPLIEYVDKVIVVAKGEILSGTNSEVLTSENMTRLYDTEVEVITTALGKRIVAGQQDSHQHVGHTQDHTGMN